MQGLIYTAGVIYNVLHFFNIPIHVQEVRLIGAEPQQERLLIKRHLNLQQSGQHLKPYLNHHLMSLYVVTKRNNVPSQSMGRCIEVFLPTSQG